MLLPSLLAAVDLAAVAYWTWIVIKVAIALGAVIFVHELGHFLAAKACGVKVEKFFIGFDIGGYKVSRRRGETEYGIGILPLGGYVKMLGQDDDPAHIAEQMQKSQVDVRNPNAVEITGPGGEKYFVDRRSYLAKSVPQRMLIISAGVVMNVIFAFIFAVVAYGMGVPYTPSIVSETMPGSPAWVAGLDPGDEIIKFGRHENPTFNQLRGSVTLGDKENGIPVAWRRAADGEVLEGRLKPEQRGLPKIGVLPGLTVDLYPAQPAQKHSPAEKARFVELSGTAAGVDAVAGDLTFLAGTIVRVGDQEITDYRTWLAALARAPDQTLRVTVRRSTKSAAAAIDGESKSPGLALEATFEVLPRPMRSFGLVMKMGPIAGVQAGSPAAEAGFKTGDVIETIDAKSISNGASDSDGWDPATLPDYFRQRALENRTVEITVRRPPAEGGGESAEAQSFSLKPRVPTTFHALLPPDTPMGVPALGLAYHVGHTVHAVKAESAAAAAGVQPGDEIAAARFIVPKEETSWDDGEPIPFGPAKQNWPQLFSLIQLAPPGTAVEFTLKRGEDTEPVKVKIEPAVVEGLFVADRGFNLMPIAKTRVAATFAEQVRYGWNETVDSLLMVYRFLQKLGGQVPLTALGGPITIAKVAGLQAAEGLSQLLIFLTMLSANLAVINFLPIPLLDGGHMVFLLYEGVRGRPANQRFVVAMHMIGFAFIVTLMLFVLGLDLNLIDRNL